LAQLWRKEPAQGSKKMIVILLALIGGFYGWRIAKKRDGNRLDKLQYAAVYCMVGTMVGLLLTVIIERLI
jgi:hypothetical protein